MGDVVLAASATEPATEPSQAKVKCEEYLKKVLTNSHINFVRLKMGELGCDTFDAEKNNHSFEFSCEPCSSTADGGTPSQNHHLGLFTVNPETNKKKIYICEENFADQAKQGQMGSSAVRRTVLHELVHAYDYCRAKFDTSNCDQLACTEVRAAMLSGDCNFVNEARRMNFGIAGQGAVCAKRRAILSLEANPHCQANAKEAVERVFAQCHKDTAPFFMKF